MPPLNVEQIVREIKQSETHVAELKSLLASEKSGLIARLKIQIAELQAEIDAIEKLGLPVLESAKTGPSQAQASQTQDTVTNARKHAEEATKTQEKKAERKYPPFDKNFEFDHTFKFDDFFDKSYQAQFDKLLDTILGKAKPDEKKPR